MKGRDKQDGETRTGCCAHDTLSRVPPRSPPSTPFFPLFSPWATWSRTGRHGNPRQSRWKLSRHALLSLRTISFASSPSFSFRLSLSTSSLFVLRPPSHPNTPIYVPTYSRPTLSVVSKLSLAPSCSFLPTRLARRSLYPLSLRLRSPSPLLPPPQPRALAFQSPGLVSLTHARRIVMGNVQMH